LLTATHQYPFLLPNQVTFMTQLPENLQEFIAKLDDAKKANKLDLSSDQDLSIAIMNLVGIEEHFFFTGAKTGKTEYYDLITQVRNIRKELLAILVKQPEGEVWCISKHLLAASYRLMEVGTKMLDKDQKETAYGFFDKAFSLYSMFWGLNLGAIGVENIKKIDDLALNKHDKSKKGVLGKLKSLISAIVNCCKE
jgi:hypothetical protein